MINIDGSLFIQIANFLFLIWALNKVLYRPIRKILIQRKKKIGGLEENIEVFQTDAKAKDQAFSDGIKAARSKGLTAREALVQEAAQEEKRIIQELNAKAQADLTEFKLKIAKDSQEVKKALEEKIDEFAGAISEKILGRAV